MISLTNVTKRFGKQVLFVDAAFQLNAGEKVGLVGPNGAGKSTIFRLIDGEETPDEGTVQVPKKITIGYFRQETHDMAGRTVLEEAIAGSGRLGDLHHELAALEHAMSDPERADEMETILERFGEVQGEYQQLGDTRSRRAPARSSTASASRTVKSTATSAPSRGLEDARFDGEGLTWEVRRPPARRTHQSPRHRVDSLARAVLRATKSALLMTCHDRDFMNRVVSRIVDIDAGELVSYTGDYDYFEREQKQRADQQAAAYTRQQAMLAKEQRFIDRFEKHAAKAAQVQSRIKKLDKIEKLELPKKRVVVPFEFRKPARSGDDVLKIVGISKRYGDRVIYDHFDFEVQRGERWCVMGVNGAGKTTLLKMVAGVIQPDSGTVRLGASLKLGYFAQQSLELLDPAFTVWEQFEHDFPSRPSARGAAFSAPSSSRATTSRSRSRSSPAARSRASSSRGCSSIRRISWYWTNPPITSTSSPRKCW